MSASSYTTITRMSGLAREMRVVANNIANASTTGYRAEQALFSEYIRRVDDTSLSMASARIGHTNLAQGTLGQTGGQFDFAIEGDGFFQVQTDDGPRLTRGGAFTKTPEGALVTMDGNAVLDAGGAPIFVPPGGDVRVAPDGTMTLGGRAFAELGLVRPVDPNRLVREGSQLFDPDGEVEPVVDTRIRQGFLEASNVDPVNELARMIEVSRAYELGQSFLESENDRLRDAIKSMSR
ncbi:flagellar basal-body rod protein FlgF [Roseivivax lentus]|uniref:Flagellar basal-body rod protein FlgF n=1 Tax=Roseivivax lentus TaxID=633194 RepID=A0A1N7JL67_9RHOB|nr:flagellar hook-basal body complex protein [Roseivivax lentus]SIS50079.1 flagellar basal-body rod protein FlgF [Roseivivax lentus]